MMLKIKLNILGFKIRSLIIKLFNCMLVSYLKLKADVVAIWSLGLRIFLDLVVVWRMGSLVRTKEVVCWMEVDSRVNLRTIGCQVTKAEEYKQETHQPTTPRNQTPLNKIVIHQATTPAIIQATIWAIQQGIVVKTVTLHH